MRVGDVGEAKLLVGPGDSAKAISLSPEDDFPDVLATSRMVALMELAAARGMRTLLDTGELSVGVGVDARHFAATPIGVEVRAEATFLGMEGKLYRFRVRAFDGGGLIGEGEHTRAIVGAERLLTGALARTERKEALRHASR